MKIEILHSYIQSLYPEQIGIGDAVVFSSVSARFPQLVKAHDKAEQLVTNRYGFDGIHYVADWSFFQAIHKAALQANQMGKAHVKTSDVTVEMLDHQIRSNIDAKGFEDIKASYEKDNSAPNP